MTAELSGPRIEFCNLPDVRRVHADKKIVFCSGAFDMLHPGHVLFFEDCKAHGDILVVEVAHDALIRKHKGEGRPRWNEHARMKMVGALRAVDYCFLDFPVEGPPLALIGEVFRILQPDAYVINQDAFDIPFRVRLAAEHGVNLVVCERSYPPEIGEFSTTKRIEEEK